jgi:signal peptidase I
MNPDVVVRRGSWFLFGVAGLYLAGMLLAPVAGAALAALFFMFGWGMRRHQVWAATAASLALVVPIALVFQNRGPGFGWALAIGVQVGIAWLPVWAAVTLWRHREIARFGKGWLAFAGVLVLAAVAVHPYAMAAGSMANTIDRGDYVLTENLSWKLGRTPRNGDVVQIRYPIDPRQLFVKRVVGVPGDRIRIVNKQLFRNGAAVAEPYAIHTTDYIDFYRDNFPSTPNVRLPAPGQEMLDRHVRDGEVVVPPGKYFVLGDNRDNSLDSRYWGFVSRAEILASPLVIYASYDVPEQHPEVTGTILNTRWNRLLKFL